MRYYHVSVYVGPTLVPTLSNKFREAGLKITVEGTSHIHCVISMTHDDIYRSFLYPILEKHNTTFGITSKDVIGIRGPMISPEQQ